MQQLLSKFNKIENEIKELKISLVKSKNYGKKVSLKGLLAGVKISEKDIDKAKKNLFSGV